MYKYDYQHTPTISNHSQPNLEKQEVQTPVENSVNIAINNIEPELHMANLLRKEEAELPMISKNQNSNQESIQETNKDDKIIYSDGSSYIGQILNGQRHGKGKFQTADNVIIYEGEWQDDIAHGIGKILLDSDLIYVGQFVKGVKTGDGKISTLNEENVFFEGNFNNGEKDGSGEEHFSDGSIYKGNYSKGSRNGRGKYYLADGAYYEGEFKLDKIEGRVLLIVK
jgi:hypothetical protein